MSSSNCACSSEACAQAGGIGESVVVPRGRARRKDIVGRRPFERTATGRQMRGWPRKAKKEVARGEPKLASDEKSAKESGEGAPGDTTFAAQAFP